MDVRSLNRRRGFTLIELLVVIAIIGILATLVVTQLASARVKARNSSAKSDVTEAGKAVEVYKNDENAGNSTIAADIAGVSNATAGLYNFVPNTALSCYITTVTATTTTAGNAKCNISSLDGAGVSNGKFVANIFTGTQTATVGTNVNSYGVKFTKTPGLGFYYYYMTEDITAPASAGIQSLNPNYAFIQLIYLLVRSQFFKDELTIFLKKIYIIIK